MLSTPPPSFFLHLSKKNMQRQLPYLFDSLQWGHPQGFEGFRAAEGHPACRYTQPQHDSAGRTPGTRGSWFPLMFSPIARTPGACFIWSHLSLALWLSTTGPPVRMPGSLETPRQLYPAAIWPHLGGLQGEPGLDERAPRLLAPHELDLSPPHLSARQRGKGKRSKWPDPHGGPSVCPSRLECAPSLQTILGPSSSVLGPKTGSRPKF